MENTKRKEEEFNHQTQKRSKIKGREEVIRVGGKEKQKLNWMQKRG